MGSGGARARSGPPANPFSARSEGREYVELPAKGFKGYVPVFPLPKLDVYVTELSDEGKPYRALSTELTEETHRRELALWRRLWRYPQASCWSREKWRQDAVAHYVRVSVRVEGPEAKAADVTAMLRLRDEIGLTPQGMSLNGWKVVEDETAVKRAAKKSESTAQERRRRFDVVTG